MKSIIIALALAFPGTLITSEFTPAEVSVNKPITEISYGSTSTFEVEKKELTIMEIIEMEEEYGTPEEH